MLSRARTCLLVAALFCVIAAGLLWLVIPQLPYGTFKGETDGGPAMTITPRMMCHTVASAAPLYFAFACSVAWFGMGKGWRWAKFMAGILFVMMLPTPLIPCAILGLRSLRQPQG